MHPEVPPPTTTMFMDFGGLFLNHRDTLSTSQDLFSVSTLELVFLSQNNTQKEICQFFQKFQSPSSSSSTSAYASAR